MHTALAFDDTIDGYFPLSVSLADLMQRRGLIAACLLIEHAPIMEIPGLHPSEPVPLTINAGRAGIIDRMFLCIDAHTLSGQASWHWLSGPGADPLFDPLTRLAEPAFLQGLHFAQGLPPNGTLTEWGAICRTGDIRK